MNLLTNKKGKPDNMVEMLQEFCKFFQDINVNFVIAEDCGTTMTEFKGLDYALNHDFEIPLLITSMTPPLLMLKNNKNYWLLKSLKNVTFIDFLNILKLLGQIKEGQEKDARDYIENIIAKTKNKKENFAAKTILTNDIKNNELAIIKHRISTPKELTDPNCRANAAEKARNNLGFSGSDNEIIEKLLKTESNAKVFKKNQYFEDTIFCDIENTLLKNNKLNENLLNKLRKKEKEGKIINLWTGGNIDNLKKIIIKEKIDWPILPKHPFAGTIIEEAFDDLSADELKRQYKVTINNLHNV